MASSDVPEKVKVVQDLRSLTCECLQRKIVSISKWSSELLTSFIIDSDSTSKVCFPSLTVSLTASDEAVLWFAQSCFDCQEFERAAKACESSSNILLRFLYYYALYLSGDKMKLDTMADIADKDKAKVLENNNLNALQNELQLLHRTGKLDSYLLYVYGLVLRDQGMNEEAEQVFAESIHENPIFYGSWRELSKSISTKERLDELKLPNTWLKQFFMAETLLSLQLPADALAIYASLTEAGFGQCPYVLAQMAMAEQNLQDLDAACELFGRAIELDPFRVEGMDCYSNALHVKGKRVELASLAHSLYNINKYCPETCCVVGNYYSLRGEHENAVTYFQRAIRLDPRHASAWTLLGHEFMELKNTAAAILAYRHAIEVDRKDYKAWYGLGQLYEILKMPNYAFYYYDMAHKLRPQDSRMVIALGEMLEKQCKLEEARRCFWKAHCIGDIEGIALLKLAKLYENKLNDSDQAAAMYSLFLKGIEEQDLSDPENQAHCYKYLAKYNFNVRNNLDEAQAFAQLWLEHDSSKEDANALLKQISSKRTERISTDVPPQNGAASVLCSPGNNNSSVIEMDDSAVDSSPSDVS